MDGLTTGRIVHYADSTGNHFPAIIVNTYGPDGNVNLLVFTVMGSYGKLNINYDPSFQPETWHWIEKA